MLGKFCFIILFVIYYEGLKVEKALAFLFFTILILLPLTFAEAGNPDVALKKINVETLQGTPRLVRISLVVKNEGNERIAKEFKVALYYRLSSEAVWKQVKIWRGKPLSPGEELTFTAMLTLKKREVYSFKVMIQTPWGDNNPENNQLIVLYDASKPVAGAYMKSMEVVVTAPLMEVPLKENPAATTVVGRDFLETMPRSIAADEALAIVPGVRVENQANGERVHLSIRGQGILTERGIRGIKIILDGLPLNDPSGFAPDLYDVDWATVKKIEVLRGPSASLYGGGAAGGIINIETEDGRQGRYNVNGLFNLGSYSFSKALVNVGGTINNLNYRVSVSHNEGDGYREHTAFKATNVYSKTSWQPGRAIKLTAILGWTDFFNENAEGLNLEWLKQNRRMANPDALIYNEYQHTKRFTSGVTGKIELSPAQRFFFAAYYRWTNYEESVPSSLQHRFLHTPGFTFQYSIKTGKGKIKNHLTVGTELQWQFIDEYRHPNLGNAVEGKEFLSDENIFQRDAGFYLMDRLELGEKWAIVFNLRHDRIYNELNDNLKAGGIDLSGQASFKETTGRIGLVWNPGPGVGFYANWGTGFLPPSTEELANNPDSPGGFNSHLMPATSRGEEIGARGYMGNTIFYDIALFHLYTKNDFGRYRIPSRPLETFYRNVGTTGRYGLEAFVAWYPVENFELELAYTYSDFKYVDFVAEETHISGTYLPNSPKHQLFMDVEYSPAKRLKFGLSIQAQSRSYIDATNEAWIDGFVLFNTRVIYTLKKGRTGVDFVLYVRNLFNKEYIAFTEPDPDGNSYQPGSTREIFAGIKFSL